jgi:hypothetical protein
MPSGPFLPNGFETVSKALATDTLLCGHSWKRFLYPLLVGTVRTRPKECSDALAEIREVTAAQVGWEHLTLADKIIPAS